MYSVLFICAIISGTSNCIASDITGAEVFGSIKNREQFAKSDISKTAIFKILTNASTSDPNQGRVLKDCAVTWEKNNIWMKMVYNYLQDPVYVPPGSMSYGYRPISYDKDKRLLVWRSLEAYIVSTPEKTEILDRLQLLRVDPNGAIEKSADIHITKHVFPANDQYDGNYDFQQFLLAAGLCFSDYIDANNIELVKTSDGNRIEINSRGTFGKNSKGTWKSTVDPDSDFFVREASFTGEGFNKPSIKMSTSDIVKKDGLAYAREGHIVLGGDSNPIIRDYVDIDISVINNQELRQEVNQHMEAPLPIGSDIIDFKGGKPTVTPIK
jgi:hypothetical protein